jgi:hypothetical protein
MESTNTTDVASTLPRLVPLQRRLLEIAPAWARGEDVAAEAASTRLEAIRLCHEHYAARVPVYRRLADSVGLAGPVDVDVLVSNLLFAGLFKSYDPDRLASGDFPAMNEWLGSVSAGLPPVEVGDCRSLGDWRNRLREKGCFLSFSSGTSGRFSFVPRDAPTYRALVTNGASYADPGVALQGFDCLVLGPRGDGIGLLDAGNGLARIAVRSHFLFDRALTADAVRTGGLPGRGELEHAEGEAVAFARAAVRDQHPLLVFGAPFQLRRLCERVASGEGRVALPPGSLVVTGGGWKAFTGERIARAELVRFVSEVLGVPPERCVDGYSTCEINATLVTCRVGRYHVPPLLEAVVVDEALSGGIGRGGEGLLGFLDPFATSYPGFVITGDRATLAFGRCGCGRVGAFIDGEVERAPGAEIRGCGGLLGSVFA